MPKRVATPIAEAVRGARAKLAEAAYFLRLMGKVERTRSPLAQGNDLASEYVFLLSAQLNACYSVVAYLEEADPPAKGLAEAFRQEHVAYYAHGVGRRSVSVHRRPVVPGHRGYRPPPGDNVIFRFAEEDRRDPPPGDQVGFDFDEGSRFYYDDSVPQNAIGNLCAVQLSALRRLIDECARST